MLAVMDQLRDLGNYGQLNDFEVLLAARCGRKHAIATSSGTAALEVVLAAVGVVSGSRVAIPALGFVAAANAVSHRGAVPILIDVRRDDFGMDPSELNKLDWRSPLIDALSAVIAVHNLGHPCRIRELTALARDRGVPLIEDAAEAVDSMIVENPCGSFGTASVLSFNLNKVVTTGGGGAVLCDDDRLAALVRRLVTTARVEHPWLVEHNAVAWNHRMPMLCAALGLAQLRRLDHMVAAKRALADAYREALADIEGVMFHGEPTGTRSNYWLPTIMVPLGERDEVLTALHNVGVHARAMFTPINQLRPYQQDGFPVADSVFRQAICLPSGLELAERFL